jgi:hypothetical protein
MRKKDIKELHLFLVKKKKGYLLFSFPCNKCVLVLI